jgi:hypothetical protein
MPVSVRGSMAKLMHQNAPHLIGIVHHRADQDFMVIVPTGSG